MLALAITSQCLKMIAWRRTQIAEIACGVEVTQFPARHLDQIGRKALRLSPLNTASVTLSRKLLIIGHVYHQLIHLSKSAYRSMIQVPRHSAHHDKHARIRACLSAYD